MTTGSEMMEASILSEEVSMKSQQERVLAGAILVPGRTFQMISKSWRNKDQRAWWRDNLRGSLIYVGEVFVVGDDGD